MPFTADRVLDWYAHEHGYQFIDEEPRGGVGGHRIAFLHPKTTAGILIELTKGSG